MAVPALRATESCATDPAHSQCVTSGLTTGRFRALVMLCGTADGFIIRRDVRGSGGGYPDRQRLCWFITRGCPGGGTAAVVGRVRAG